MFSLYKVQVSGQSSYGRGDRHDPEEICRYGCNRWRAWLLGYRIGGCRQRRSDATACSGCGPPSRADRLGWTRLARPGLGWTRLGRTRLARPRLGWARICWLGWPAAASTVSFRHLHLSTSRSRLAEQIGKATVVWGSRFDRYSARRRLTDPYRWLQHASGGAAPGKSA